MINNTITNALAPVYQLIKDIHGVDMSYVRINLESMNDGQLGQFRPNESYIDIFVNEKYFDVVTDKILGIEEYKDVTALLQTTVLHELNHVAQFALNKAISIDVDEVMDIELLDVLETQEGIPYREQSTEIDSRLMELLFIARNHREFADTYIKHLFTGVPKDSVTMKKAINVLQVRYPELLHEIMDLM